MVARRGACVVAQGVGGACVVAPRGGMHGCSQVGVHGCPGGGHAWLLRGACMVAPRGACMGYDEIRRYNQWAGGMHPTGMHSCYNILLLPTNEVWGKVIFLHLFVVLFTGGGLLTRGSACSRRWDAWSGPWGVFSRGCLVLGVLRGVPGLVRGGSALGGVPGPGGSLVPGGCLLPGEVPGGDLPGRLLLRAARILLGCMEEEGPKIFKLVKNKLCLEFNQK